MKLSEKKLCSGLRTDAGNVKLNECKDQFNLWHIIIWFREKGSWYPAAGLEHTHVALQNLAGVLLALSIDC